MKIKCLRFECEVCNRLASIKVFCNRNGAMKYARARHYLSRVNSKPHFEYHQQSLEYIQRKLRELPMDSKIGNIGQLPNVDLNKAESSSKQETKSRGWELYPRLPRCERVFLN
jgi:hypothetical protein